MCSFTYELFFMYARVYVFEFYKLICWSINVNLLATALFHVYVPLLNSMHVFDMFCLAK
jgi:ABC-type thiamin/hydroxymethylpyrimidine transport system permease subunit